MNKNDLIQLVILICSVAAIMIPFMVKLYHTTEDLVREKNWPRLVSATVEYMEQAEELLEYGADRKEWVIAMVRVTADQINYELTDADIKNLEDLIDELCDMSKIVNPPAEVEVEVKEEAAE